MAKKEKTIVKKLEGVQVLKDGIAYQILIGENGMTVVRLHPDIEKNIQTAFYWDWAAVAEKLTERDELQRTPGELKPDPHAQPGGVPQGISSTK